MADYDLGTAHGEIVIDNDRKATQATIEALRGLKESVNRLEHQIKSLDQTLKENASSLRGMAKEAHGAADSMGDVETRTRKANVQFTKSVALTQALGGGLKYAGSMAIGLADNMSGVIRSFSGIKKMSATEWAAGIIKTGGAVQDLYRHLAPLRGALSGLNSLLSIRLVNSSNALGVSFVRLNKTGATFSEAMRKMGPLANTLTLKMIRLDKAIGDLPKSLQSLMKALGTYLALESMAAGALNSVVWQKMAAGARLVHRQISALAVGMAQFAAETARAAWASILASSNFRLLAVKAMRAKLAIAALGTSVAGSATQLISGSSALRLFSARAIRARNAVLPFMASIGAGAVLWKNYGQSIISSNPALKTAIGHIKNHTQAANANAKALKGMAAGGSQMAKGLFDGIFGLALMKSSIKGLTKFVDYGAIALAGLGTAGFALTKLSSALVGLANAAKQLSGILFALPAAITAAAIAGGVALVAFKGLKSAFTGGMKSGEEFTEALAKMSPEMQKVAKAVNASSDRIRKMKDTISDNVFAGLGDDIAALVNGYLPLLESGISGVSRSMRTFSLGAIEHLSDPKTFSALNETFKSTGIITANLGRSVRPALDGFRDLGTVGTKSLADLSRGSINVASSFRLWAADMASTGELDAKIKSSIQGFKDLGVILKETGGLLGDVFSKIAGHSGDNALARWADDITKFRSELKAAMNDSSGLANFLDYIKRLGVYTARAFELVVDAIKDLNSSAGEDLAAMGESLMVGLIAGIRDAIIVLKALINTLTSIPGGEHILGIVASFAAMNKVLEVGLKGFSRLGAGIYGAGKAFKGALAGLGGWVTAVNSGTKGSDAMRKALDRLKVTAIGAQIAFAAMAAVIAAAIAVFVAYNYQRSKEQTEQRELQAEVQKTAEAYDRLKEAIYAAGGAMTDEGYSAMGEMLQSARDQARKNTEEFEGPSWFDRTQDVGSGISNAVTLGLAGSGQESIKATRNEMESERVANLLSDMTDEEMSKMVASDGATYSAWIQQFKDAGNAGQEVAAKIQVARDAFKELTYAAEQVGGPALALQAALTEMGEAGDSSSKKLDALRAALAAMGLLKTDAATAAMAYSEAIRKLGEEAAQAADANGLMGDSLMKAAVGISNGVHSMDSNANSLTQSLIGVSDKFLETVSHTGDAKAAYADLQPVLDQLGDKYKLTSKQIEELAASYGLVPGTVETLLSVAGEDEVAQAMVMVLTSFDRIKAAGSEPITIPVKTQGAVDELSKLGFAVSNFNDNADTAQIKIKADVDPQTAMDNLRKWMAQNTGAKVDVDGQLKPGAVENIQKQVNNNGQGYEVGIDPKIKGVNDKFFSELGPSDPNMGTDQMAENIKNNFAELARRQAEARKAAGGATPPVTGETQNQTLNNTEQNATESETVTKSVTVKVLNADVALGAIQGVKNAMDSLRDKTVKLGVTNADAAWGAVQGVKNVLSSLRDKTVRLGVTNADAAWGAVQGVKNAMDSLRDKSVKVSVTNADVALGAVQGVIQAFEDLGRAAEEAAARISSSMNSAIGAIDNVKSAINGLTSTMNQVAANALASGQTLGQNFANGINSKVDAVRQASMNLARAAAEPLPSSPAKIGPFSGKGWTPYRGRTLAEGFAKGIQDGSSSAKGSALDLATMVSKALDSMESDNKLFKFQRTYFDANRTPGVGGKRYYRDTSVSDEDLAKARQKKAEDEAQEAKDTAYREGKKAGANIPEQEKKVAEAKDKVAKAEERLAKAEKDDERAKANESLNDAKRKQTDQEKKLQEMRDAAAKNPDAASSGSAAGGVAGGLTANDARSDYIEGMSAIAERFGLQLTSGVRDEPGSYHNDGSAGDFSNGSGNTDEMLAFANFINDNFKPWTKELIYDDPRFSGKQIGDGENVDDSYYANAGDHTNHVHWAVNAVPEWSADGGLSPQGQSGGSNEPVKVENVGQDTIPLVQNPDGTYSSTNAEWDKLIQRESGGNFQIVQGIQDANSGGNEASGGFQIAKGTWAANGGKEFAETAGQASAEQQAIVAARIFNAQGGAPWGSGAGQNFGRENEELLREGIARGGAGTASTPGSSGGPSGGSASEATAEEQLKTLRSSDAKLDETIKVLENPTSSEAEVIRSLQDLDDRIAVTEDPDIRDALNTTRETTMSERGIKEYDPNEGASDDVFMDAVGIAQNVLGIYNTVMQGADNAKATIELMARGLENTNDVHSMVDGFQSLVEAITSVVSTIGGIIDIVGRIAAAAGSAIPGVGQVVGAISAVTGGIGNINAVMDLVQEGFKIAGRWVGTALSWLAGGANGPLTGDVKTLLDTNDNTLKSWSSDNPMDKRVHSLSDPFATNGYDPYAKQTVYQNNIYANPNAPASEIVNELGYAMRVNGSGAYSE